MEQEKARQELLDGERRQRADAEHLRQVTAVDECDQAKKQKALSITSGEVLVKLLQCNITDEAQDAKTKRKRKSKKNVENVQVSKLNLEDNLLGADKQTQM